MTSLHDEQAPIDNSFGQTKATLQLLVASVRDYAIFLLDRDGNVATWNAGAERIKGYRADEIIGRHFSIFYPSADVLAGKPGNELKIAAAAGRLEDEGWRVCKDGSLFWANVVITALYSPRGELLGYGKVTQDLTERRRAEQERLELARSQSARTQAELMLERVSRLAEASRGFSEARLEPAAIAAIAAREAARLVGDGSLVAQLDANNSALQVIAVTHREPSRGARAERAVLGDIPLEIESPASALTPEDSAELARGVVDRLRSALDADETGVELGETMTAELRTSGGPAALLLAWRDVTPSSYAADDRVFFQELAERAALALDNARLYQESQRAIKLRDEFLTIAAHELKTPITSLRIAAQHLRARFEPVIPEATRPSLRTALTAIDQQSGKLARLISQVLDISRIELGRLELERERVDITALVRVLAGAADDWSSRHGVVFSAAANYWTSADPLRLEQALANLLDNAIKFSPQGGRIEVEVGSAEPESVHIAVRDYGIGIPSESRRRIFERYFQAHAESYQSGLGLGLTVARQIIELHGGTLRAEFPEPFGSRFVIELPLLPALEP